MKRLLTISLLLMLFIGSVSAITNTTFTVDSDTVMKFNGTGSMNWTAPSGVTSIWYLVVAPGGGAASGNVGGGGGAGGLLNGTISVIPGQEYNIMIGLPGVGGAAGGYNPGTTGENSSFGTTINAAGGGLGKAQGGGNGGDGGSGGGGAAPATTTGGTNVSGQGFPGAGCPDSLTGGGGAGGAGENGWPVTTPSHGGLGGNGTSISITGLPIDYAGGGAGCGNDAAFYNGGLGGGGQGSGYPQARSPTANGTDDLGGGGGCGGYDAAANMGGYGGLGVVILRYSTGGNSIPTASFSTNATQVIASETIQFNDTSSGVPSPTTWLWQWGDGTVNSTTQNPVHIFSDFGVYYVNLTATNSEGSDTSSNTAIYVTPNFTRFRTTPIITADATTYPWEGNNLADPVFFDNGTYLNMYYGGYIQSQPGGSVNRATSPIEYPPTNWTRAGMIFNGTESWEDGTKQVRLGSVIQLPNGTYYMYYGSGDTLYMDHTGLATSPDGITWTKYAGNPVLEATDDESDVESLWVYYDNTTGLFHGYYGYQKPEGSMYGIRYAQSTNGVNWTKYTGTDVYHTGTSGDFDDAQVEHHQIFKYQGLYWMAIEVYDGSVWRIALARNTAHNGTFTKMGIIFEPNSTAGAWDQINVATPYMFMTPGTTKWNIMYQGGASGSYPAGPWNIGIASENIPSPSITADFSCSPLTRKTNEIISCTDETTSFNITSWTWNWSFGDGTYNTTQNPIKSYSVEGTYDVNLTVYNSTVGYSSLLKPSYITISDNLSGWNRQDIMMDQIFTLTLNIKDASTFNGIPGAVIQTSNGDNTTTDLFGISVLTMNYSAIVVTVGATGYYSRTISYVVDRDRTETIYLTAITVSPTPQTITYYTPWQVRIRIADYNGNPLPGTNVTANYIASTLPSTNISWLITAYGVQSATAAQMLDSGVAMTGVTDSNGGLSFSMFKSIQYALLITNTTAGVSATKNLYPSDQEYLIRVPLAGQLAVNNTLASMSNTSLPVYQLNSTAYNLSVIYRDTSGLTTDVLFIVKFRNGTILHNEDLGNPGTGTVVGNYTIINPGIGTEVLWSYNALRSGT